MQVIQSQCSSNKANNIAQQLQHNAFPMIPRWLFDTYMVKYSTLNHQNIAQNTFFDTF